MASQLARSQRVAQAMPFRNVRLSRRFRFRKVISPRTVAGGGILWSEGGVLALILISQTAGQYAGATTITALAVWACRNTKCALQAMTVSVLVTFANPALVGDQPLVPLLKWVLLFVSLGRVLGDWKYQPRIRTRWIAYFTTFAMVALGLSLAVSGNRSLSLLKLATFIGGVAIALLGVRDRRYRPDYWLSWFATVCFVVLVLSAPLEFLPAGRHSNGRGFQGILNHPQAYGVYMVPITVFWTITLLTKRRESWFLVVVVPWAWYSLFTSGCRTAFLAAGLSVAATVASVAVFPRNAPSSSERRSIFLKMCAIGMLALAVLATSASQLTDTFRAFIMKADRDSAIESSRQMQVDGLLSSIDENPLAGVGFGLAAASVEQVTERDELTGLPTSAPTEQGFLPLAVLVQVGITGAVPLLFFLATLAFPVAKYGSPAVVALFFCALFVNFGEMIFFSTGALGMHMWLLIACCLGQSLAPDRSVRA